MTEPTRYRVEAVEPPLPLGREPAPMKGCAGCAELAEVRDRARAGGDMTTVTDCNVLIRKHPEGHK
ncbi:hypothetical protein [Streptomyces sp. x-19]|uniref:hypothetical protein n=1 Tax=Streptomyces sp. x-19 TaxID=2789280 RepID=UPI0039805D59